jgi:Zn-dependent protease with chaperone function
MVTIYYAVASFLAALTSAWIGSLIALRSLGKPPPVFWIDRARLAYPARLATGRSALFLPLLLGAIAYGGGLSPRSGVGVWTIEFAMVGGYLGCLWVSGATEKRIQGTAFRVEAWRFNVLRSLVARLPEWGTVLVTVPLIPGELNSHAVEILITAMAVIALATFGGSSALARWLGLMKPASPRLAAVVAEAAKRTGIQPRAAYQWKSMYANAFAFPLRKHLAVADRALEVLTDAELTSVCAHELAHLTEPTAVTMLRVGARMLFFATVIAIRPIAGSFGENGVTVAILVVLITMLMVKPMARRMEVRADAMAHAHQGDEGTYARALERLHEASLTPVVMVQQRRTHPDLYDRLLAAGVTPSYPRPQLPENPGFAVIVTLITGAVLYEIALTILGAWFAG